MNPQTSFTGRTWRSLLRSSCVLLCGVAACVEPHAVQPDVPDQGDLLYRVRFEYNSIILAVQDTVQLGMTAYSLGGDTIAVPASSIVWRSDNDAITIDSAGRMIGNIRSFSPIQVIGSWTLDAVERRDTMEVWVLDTELPVAYVKVLPLDSARKGYNQTNEFDPTFFDIHAYTADELPLEDITLPSRVSPRSEPTAVTVAFPFGFGLHGLYAPFVIGDLWFTTKALIFGVAYQDSAKYTGLYPSLITVPIRQFGGVITHEQKFAFLQVCGTIQFTNGTTTELTIDFDRETADVSCGGTVPASGSLTLASGQTADRVVSRTGTFRWSGKPSATNTAIRGLEGTFTVRDIP